MKIAASGIKKMLSKSPEPNVIKIYLQVVE